MSNLHPALKQLKWQHDHHDEIVEGLNRIAAAYTASDIVVSIRGKSMVPLLRARSCSSCAFHDTQGQQLTCHAAPPNVTPLVVPDKSGRPIVIGHVTSWPVVAGDSWCGAWSGLKAADPIDLKSVAAERA